MRILFGTITQGTMTGQKIVSQQVLSICSNIGLTDSIPHLSKNAFTFRIRKVLWICGKVRNSRYSHYYDVLSFGILTSVYDLILMKLIKLKGGRGIIICLHIHSSEILNMSGFRKWIITRTLRMADKLVFLDESLIPQINLATAVYVIPNFVVKNMYSFRALERTKKASYKLLFLSNLILEKGIIETLELYEKMKAEGLDVELKIVGNIVPSTDPWVIDEIKRVCECSDCTWYVNLSREEIVQKLDWATFLIFPTRYKTEAFPMVVLEAISRGVVPLVRKAGAIGNMVKYSEFVYVEWETKRVINDIKRIQSNINLHREILSSNAQHIQKLCSYEKFEASITELFL